MFDEIQANNESSPGNNLTPIKSQTGDDSQTKMIIIGIILFGTIVALVFFVLMKSSSFEESPDILTSTNSASSTNTINKDPAISSPVFSTLPTGVEDELGSNLDNKSEQLRSEILSFGSFYKVFDGEIESQIVDLELPINIKIDVSNYYDTSRKINLDAHIDNLNNNGFSIISNPFGPEAGNFFGAYNELSKRQIPTLVTADFATYYYQNTIKSVFKNIEKDIFYNDLWEIARQLFVTADKRYKLRLSDVGYINDPLLEAARREAAYFATVLEILKPKEQQIATDVKNDNLFHSSELARYSFALPSYLKNDVVPELRLIMDSKELIKSPVLLFERDYSSFTPPAGYKENAKLSNFYLATHWLSSPFPIYYKGSICKDCLLDKDEWRINFLTAHYISEDFSEKQELANKWANIYKTLSYFKGLKKGVNYTQLATIFKDTYPDKGIDEIFSLDNTNRDHEISNLQKQLIALEYRAIEGGLDANSPINYSKIGMRVLQEQYWPNGYIFKKLTNEAGEYNVLLAKRDLKPITYCKKKDITERCRGIGRDVINLVSTISNDAYFAENIAYSSYDLLSTNLSKELSEFNTHDWHNNNYWNTLHIIKKYLNNTHNYQTPSYFKHKEWEQRKINAALAMWTNLHTPIEMWKSRKEEKTDSFDLDTILDIYIEPDVLLIEELKANTIMLRDMLISLNTINENNFSYLQLNNLANKLDTLSIVIKNELSNIGPDYYDLKNLDNLLKKYTSVSSDNAKTTLEFADNKNITEDITGIKYLIVIYEIDGEKKLSIGPIYNYREYIK